MAHSDDSPAPPSPADEPARLPWQRKAVGWLKDAALFVVILAVGSVVIGKLRAPDLPDIAPDFALVDVDGQTHRLSDLKGKKVVLNFWATWCAPCRAEVPMIADFVDDHPEVEVWGVAVDGRHPQLKEKARDIGINYLVLRGTDDVVRTYGASTVPTTVFVDENGRITSAHVGVITQLQLWWETL